MSALEAYLDDLAERPAGALVVKLARQPGSRESRYAQLLCGPVAADALPARVLTPADPAGVELDELRGEVRQLRRLVDHLYRELGVAEPGA